MKTSEHLFIEIAHWLFITYLVLEVHKLTMNKWKVDSLMDG